jgi:hypothetical protein
LPGDGLREARGPDQRGRAVGAATNLPFGRLAFLYTPSADVAADARYLTAVLGGELAFAIEDGGIRVAMVRLGPEPPALLLTDHLEGDRPIHVYEVDDLGTARRQLEARGWRGGRSIELPSGPAISFDAPGGLRFAILEPIRPFVVESFLGRRDFEV